MSSPSLSLPLTWCAFPCVRPCPLQAPCQSYNARSASLHCDPCFAETLLKLFSPLVTERIAARASEKQPITRIHGRKLRFRKANCSVLGSSSLHRRGSEGTDLDPAGDAWTQERTSTADRTVSKSSINSSSRFSSSRLPTCCRRNSRCCSATLPKNVFAFSECIAFLLRPVSASHKRDTTCGRSLTDVARLRSATMRELDCESPQPMREISP